jgi:hypothetical protein
MIYGLEMAEGYDLSIERMRQFKRDLAETRDDGVFFLSDRIAGIRDRRLDLLNVKFVVVTAPSQDFDQLARRPERFVAVYREGSIAVFENKSVLPRAFAVPQSSVEVIPNPPAQLDRLKDSAFDPLHSVIVSQPLPEGTAAATPFSSDVRLST